MDKSIQITLMVVLGAIIIALIFSNSFGIQTGETISAQGVSSVKAMPDLITIHFNVETKAKTSENATKLNSDIVETLKASLIAKGFDEKEIKTQGFSVYPDYTWDSTGKRKDNGFIATHSIKLEISADESEKIGEAIDAGVSAGAGISYINFELSQEKQNEYKAEAMRLAAEDAKIKAKATASGFGKDIGRLVSVSTNEFNYYPWRAYSSSGMAEDAIYAKSEATSITPSEQEITASVSAVFKIK